MDADSAVLSEVLPPGPYVCLTVRDTGCGMDPSTMDRIFHPYFTTKKVGEGSGLGLAVVLGILKRHGGTIRVSSETGKGTAFEILIPRIKAQKLDKKTKDPIVGGSQRILFVDDEEQLVKLSDRMLAQLGYQVTARMDCRDALKIFQADPRAFDLVITDYTMPHMTGMDLARALLQIRPNIPIILCTGYSELVDENSAKAMGISAYAMKPLDRSKIARLIRNVLDMNEK